MDNHPDKYTLSAAAAQDDALIKSTRINEGYKVLKDDHKRLKYLLQLFGVNFEEGKETVPQSFLMEMMDINEKIMELQIEPDEDRLNELKSDIKSLDDRLFEEVSPLFIKFEKVKPLISDLKPLKDYYLKKQYLNNLLNNLKNG